MWRRVTSLSAPRSLVLRCAEGQAAPVSGQVPTNRSSYGWTPPINSVTLVGRLSKEPTTFTSQTGKEGMSFTLYTHKRFSLASGEKRDRTDSHKIQVTHPGVLSNLKRLTLRPGALIYVRGELQSYPRKVGEQQFIASRINPSDVYILRGGRSTDETNQQ
ncbi:Single-stranded DNA-binding protein [Balamuthia mandrillaris]